MKTLACRLIAVLSLGLSSAIFAAGQEDLQVTGKIVELYPGSATLDTGEPGASLFYINTAFDTAEKHLKVGQRVTFHYYVTGRGKLIADTVENAGKSQNGSKNR